MLSKSKDLHDLELLEKSCKEGRLIFYTVGMALGEIRDRKLYMLKGFKTYEDYCESIGFARRYCNQLIMDAETVASLPENLRKLVTSGVIARELSKLPASLRDGVLIEAAKSVTPKRPLSGAAIKKHSPTPPPRPATKPIAAATPPASSAKPPAKIKPKAPEVLDGTGLEVPVEIQDLWNRGHEVQELLTYLSAVRSRLKKSHEARDVLYIEVNFIDVQSKLNQAYEDIKTAIPFAVCPICSGKTSRDCMACKGRGMVSKFYWDNCVAEEFKQLRN